MWFLKDLGRLNQERLAIESLSDSCTWLDGVHWRFDGPQLVVDADIRLEDDRSIPIELRFPEVYPSSPASVRPKDAGVLSGHQYIGGELCLEVGPDNWHPASHTASLLLESTYRLLTLETEHATDATVRIPDRHALTDGQAQRFEFLRWVVTPDVIDTLNALPQGPSYRCDVIDVFHEQALTAFLSRIERANGADDWLDPGVPGQLKNPGRLLRGAIITGNVGALTLAQLDQAEVISSLLEEPALPDSQDEGIDNALDNISYVFVKGFGGRWEAHCRWTGGGKVWRCSMLEADTAPHSLRHGMDTVTLCETSVALVGLGSAGSKIATSLARTGVGRFVLLDDDLLHPANLVRHDHDWTGVGQHKVDAVADRIALINPSADVVRRRLRLHGQEASSSAASALAALGGADLIIDATANPAVFTLCAHVAKHSKKPLLWLEVFAGGIGGLIARARPDTDAEPFTLRAAVHAAANEIAEHKGVEAPGGASNYGAVVEDEIVTATDADVSVLSAQATQIALDTLLQPDPTRFPHPAYLVGMARAWVFEEAFHTIPVDCSAPVDWSSVVETDKATRNEASAFIVSLLETLPADADAETAA
ncbi:MAG: ThiF family adenylyltransferase [Pseudomonadota bacterium]